MTLHIAASAAAIVYIAAYAVHCFSSGQTKAGVGACLYAAAAASLAVMLALK